MDCAVFGKRRIKPTLALAMIGLVALVGSPSGELSRQRDVPEACLRWSTSCNLLVEELLRLATSSPKPLTAEIQTEYSSLLNEAELICNGQLVRCE